MSKHNDNVEYKKMQCSFSGIVEVTTNDDLLIEILLWLPTKQLTRFKLVSKRWSSLIATHRFSHVHTLRHPNPRRSLLLRAGWYNDLYYFHPKAQQRYIPSSLGIHRTKIVSSSGGLLLLQFDDRTNDYNPHNPPREYYVYNPTTRQSRKISFAFNREHYRVLALILVFDPLRSPHYKIFCMRIPTSSYPHFSMSTRSCPFDLYDSETLTWTKIGFKTFYGIRMKFNLSTGGIHCNNVIHWVNHPSTHKYYDMGKNIFGDLPMAQIPPHRNAATASYRYQLQESDGRLYQLITISAIQWKSIAIYELQADYSMWLLLYHRGFSQYQEDYLRILNFVRGVGEETSTLVFHVPDKILAYRFSDMSFEELLDLKNEPVYQCNLYPNSAIWIHDGDAYQFQESLANV